MNDTSNADYKKNICKSCMYHCSCYCCCQIFCLNSELIRSSQAQVTNSTTAQPSKQQITPEQKAKMCSPSSPNLKFVNTTESQICGVPPSQKTTPAASPTSPANATRVSQLLQQHHKNHLCPNQYALPFLFHFMQIYLLMSRSINPVKSH